MKKMFVALMILAVSLGGYATAGERTVTFHAGAVGGLYMEPSIVWAEQMREAVPELQVSCILGGAGTNPVVVSQGNPNENIGVTDTVTAIEVLNGTGEYEKRLPGGTDKLRALWRYNVKSWVHVLVRPQVVPEGVTTFGELLEKNPAVRIQMKPRGTDPVGPRLLEAYGYDIEKLRSEGGSLTFNNPADMAPLMIDGHADVAICSARAPAAYILDIEASLPDLRWLALEEDVADRMAKEFGYIKGEQPTGDYSSQKAPFLTIALDHFVFAHEDMDEEFVYTITKAVLQGVEKVRAAVPAMRTFEAKEAGINNPIPLHKGAIRAYKELGLPYEE